MAAGSLDSTVASFNIKVDIKEYPSYDPFHGTNEAMIWRQVVIEAAAGSATFEQTDYGHAGRFNPWETRGVDPGLLPDLRRLEVLADAAAQAAT